MALKAIKKVGALMLVLTVFVGVTAPVFVKLFFGVEFMPAVKLIRYLLPGVFCYGLTIIFMQQLSARGIPMLLLWIWFVGLFVNVILSYILIPTYYAVGAAVASSLSYGIALILCGGLFYFSSKRS